MGCKNFNCRHNVFWKELKIKRPKETPFSESINNCMLNVVKESSLEEIGQMWGLTREAIRQAELRILTTQNRKLKVIKKMDIRDFT